MSEHEFISAMTADVRRRSIWALLCYRKLFVRVAHGLAAEAT